MSLRLALVAVLLCLGIELPAEAHDIYSGLKDAAGASCCNEHDCRPAPYRMTSTGVQMYVDGDWFDVPERTIQYRALPGDTGETRGGHWCGTVHFEPDHKLAHVTRCAILPPNSASALNRHQE
jgi:hypothetical protein